MLLDQILINVPCPIFWKNLNGEFLGCNKLFLQTGGFYDYCQLIGKKDEELPWKQYKDEYYEDDQTVINTGKTVTRIENIPLYGRVIISETTKSPLIQDGKIIGVLGICLDITDRIEKENLALENIKSKQSIFEQENFRKVVGQMVHDIQGPISSLQMTVNSTKEIPEEKRVTLRDIAITISDITGDLLNQFELNKNDEEKYDRRPILLSTILAGVVGDRRRKYKNLPIKFDYQMSNNNAFLFTKLNPVAFKRSISNLINNGVEALPKKGGNITLRLWQNNNGWIYISVKDDGKGIPKKILQGINAHESVTDKKDGHGIGMMQVHRMLEKNHGEIDIESSNDKQRHYTEITLKFPQISPPDWIAAKMDLIQNDIIVILDDDTSIHGGWSSRLNYISEKMPNLTIKYYFIATEAIDFINKLTTIDKKRVNLLTDYELIGQELNGLDVITKTKIKRSTLVTSYYSDKELQKRAQKNNVRILPKDLVHLVDINIIQALKPGEVANVHMVFVDDVAIYTRNLINTHYKHLITESYTNPHDFLDKVDRYAKDTKLILDNYYNMEDGTSYNIDGIGLAQQLHAKGYTNLYLLSGEPFKTPEYLKLVLKNDLHAIANLDKL